MNQGRKFKLLGLVLVLSGCSHERRWEDILAEGDRQVVPGQFQVNGKKFLLSSDDACAIHDDFIRYTADFGARTIHFGDRAVTRHLFAGRTDPFHAAEPAERAEFLAIAKAALKLNEPRQLAASPVGKMIEQRRTCLLAFLEHPD